MNVEVNTENGIWTCGKDAHSFDAPLASAISALLRKEKCSTVIDVGCGSGDYVNHLRICGFNVMAIDGNSKTTEFCEKAIVLDVSIPIPTEQFGILPVPKSNWALCLEVGEHIPPSREQTFIDNVCMLFENGIVLSWFPIEGHGIGHFNPRPNEYVKEQFMKRGFISDEMAQANLREAATLWWFKSSLMCFRRV